MSRYEKSADYGGPPPTLWGFAFLVLGIVPLAAFLHWLTN